MVSLARMVGFSFGFDLECGVRRCVAIPRNTVSRCFLWCFVWLLLGCGFPAGAQTNEWTWMGGRLE